MKKIYVGILFLLLFPFGSYAQTVEISGFGGYMFASRMNGSGGYLRFHDNALYGGQLSVGVSRVMDIDLIYTRTDTRAESYFAYWDYESVPLSVNYIMGGFTKNFRVNPTVVPFFGMSLGACVMAPKEKYEDVWFFAAGMTGGAKLFVGKRFGFRVQGQLLMPVQGSGFTMFVGSGGPSGGISLYGSMLQFGISGGVILRLGNVE